MDNKYSDQQILQIFSDDNPDYAFYLLVEKYQKSLYSTIRKILINHEDTNDVLQETFIKIYKNLSEFREESKLFSWMYRIAVNEAIGFIRKQKRRFVFSTISYEDNLIQTLHSDPFFDGDEMQKKLQSAILKLPQKQRLVFNMKYYDDLKYEAISEILGTSVGALKASYHHAVKKIEKHLNDN
jgi:RNA polymerase sigma-70 factor, ECF subfamily